MTGAVLAAALLGACGAGEDEPVLGPSQSVVTTVAPPLATSAARTGVPASRPGPPTLDRCTVSVDDAAPRLGGTVTATVRSGRPDALFLARIFDASASTATSATTDASGTGSVKLQVPGPPAAGPVQIEISIAGGAEGCSTTFTPR